jgi:hypothetical protein
MNKLVAFLFFPVVLNLSGCMNMPTPPVEITPSYVSPIRYKSFSCNELYNEKDSLSEQENTLNYAQTQRIKSSKVQAFWFGFGQGDSVEAPELADVKGRIFAVNAEIRSKKCSIS